MQIKIMIYVKKLVLHLHASGSAAFINTHLIWEGRQKLCVKFMKVDQPRSTSLSVSGLFHSRSIYAPDTCGRYSMSACAEISNMDSNIKLLSPYMVAAPGSVPMHADTTIKIY